ncbi:hypothetical protein BSUBE1_3302 [Bacillus subtilis E1]|nr:hypothetical protein BSUBE1_3302 [Bacillus subtilis E1]
MLVLLQILFEHFAVLVWGNDKKDSPRFRPVSLFTKRG